MLPSNPQSSELYADLWQNKSESFVVAAVVKVSKHKFVPEYLSPLLTSLPYYYLIVVVVLETESLSVTQSGLEPRTLQPQPPEF